MEFGLPPSLVITMKIEVSVPLDDNTGVGGSDGVVSIVLDPLNLMLGKPFKPVAEYIGAVRVPTVAFNPFVDLSFHCVTDNPFIVIEAVSAASSQRARPCIACGPNFCGRNGLHISAFMGYKVPHCDAVGAGVGKSVLHWLGVGCGGGGGG